MKRLVGSIVVAIILFLNSLLFLGLLYSGVRFGNIPAEVKISFYSGCSIFALWGIVTGVGLIKTKPWARYSTLFVSCCWGVFGLLVVVGMVGFFFFISREFSPSAFIVVLSLAVALIGIPGSFLYYFNRRDVKEAFVRSLPPDAIVRRRPFGVLLIGVSSILGGFSQIPYAFYRSISTPIPFFGFWISGIAKTLWLLASIILSIFLGVGLLRLKELARRLTIAWNIFLSTDILLILLRIPADEFFEKMRSASQTNSPVLFSGAKIYWAYWGMMGLGLILEAIVIVYLWKARKHFVSKESR